MRTIMKDKVIWALVLIVCMSGVGIYGSRAFFSNVTGRVATIVSFNFDGVDEGLNPQGGVFDAQKIKSDEVIQGALDKLEWKSEWSSSKEAITDIAQHIRIRGMVPQDVMSRIMPRISDKKDVQLDKVGGMTYHPTQYEVALSLTKDIPLSNKEATQLVDAIVESYTDYFVTRYKDTQAIEAAITQIDPERYDYSEYIDLISGQLEIIKSYLSSKEQSAKDFKSSTTSLSFGDLIAQVELIENIEVGNVKSLLDSFVITKSSTESAVIYDNMIHRMKRENERYKQEAQILKNAANSYQKDKQVILGSGTIIQKPEEETKEKPLYDMLVEQATEVENKANRLGRQVQYYEGLLANLKNQAETGRNIAPYVKEVEQGIVYISEQMSKTMTDVKATVDDYYTQEVFEGSITPVMAARYQSSFRLNLIKDTISLAKITLMMMLVGLIYLLGRKRVKE